MRIKGVFEAEVDEHAFEDYSARFADRQIPMDKVAENYIAAVLLGMYRGSTPDAVDITVNELND